MAAPLMRRLLTRRRHVPLDIADDYLNAWATLQREIERIGGHAWLFRRAGHEDHFIEFVEWTDVAAPFDHGPVAAAAAELDTYAAAAAPEEWEEAR